jgi:hypothetical protein
LSGVLAFHPELGFALLGVIDSKVCAREGG